MMIKVFINPEKFVRFSNLIFKPLFFLSFVTLCIGLIFAFYLSPDDYQQGSIVRIMYIHVPSAWLALLTLCIMTFYSIIALAFKIPFGFIVNTAVAPIGATFTFICLLTGSLWGKPMWGTWWVWDARITSVLILFFLYLGLIALHQAFENRDAAARACAVLAIVGAVNIPIIYWSVEWWYSLHQPASIKFVGESTIHPTMLRPLMATLSGMYLFFGWVLLLFVRAEIIEREKNTRWVQALVSGK